VVEVTTLIPKAKLFTFQDRHLLLESMQVAPEPKVDVTTYAAAKIPAFKVEVTPAASVSATITPEPAIEEHHIDNTEATLNADKLFDMVNQHRTDMGLPPLQKDDRLMQIAQARAPEIFDEIFVNGNMHAGFYGRNLPYWATENLIYMGTEEKALNWWLHSPVHRHAIEGEYQFAGIGCDGKACSLIFSSFVAK
jgi:uncharacterized protein YkwD